MRFTPYPESKLRKTGGVFCRVRGDMTIKFHQNVTVYNTSLNIQYVKHRLHLDDMKTGRVKIVFVDLYKDIQFSEPQRL